MPHLSYVGDADVGEGTNLGASTITANYDGRAKHRTTIGARVRSSVHVSFVAPVTVGDDAYTGAGSVIVDDVPAGRARDRPGAADEHRGLCCPQERRSMSIEIDIASGPAPTLAPAVSPSTSLPIDYDKRLMLFSGRANPELAAKIADKIGVDLGPDHAQVVLQRRGLLPLRGVDPRRRRLHHPADLRQPARRASAPTTR